MGSKQITNPQGAFGYTDLTATLYQEASEFKAGGTITANTPVSITSTGTVIATATDGVAVIGVALESGVSGDTINVCLKGVVTNVSAGGATTNGTQVIRSATTAGYVTSSATPVVGTVVGMALGASASNKVTIWVNPGTNTSS